MFTKQSDLQVPPGLRTIKGNLKGHLIKSHNRYHSVNCITEMLCFMQGFDTHDNKTNKTKETKLLSVKNRLLRKSRSSSNFGSAGQQRSAPTTPQTTTITPNNNNNNNSGGGSASASGGSLIEPPQSQPCTPGCISPSIQRSPSHSLFTKCDKASLKHLSTSTPAMTAQAQLPEPPSPKTAKEPKKVPTMSKARQKKFNRHFPSVDDEKVLNYYSCALIGDILLQGHLYITKNYFAFYSNVFGYVTKLLIPMLSVEKITKEKTARIIPNAVGIATSEDKHVFGSLMSRDNTYRYMVKVWEVAQNASLLVVEPEIEPVPLSDSDSSETRDGESGRDSPLPPLTNRLQIKVSDSDNATTTTASSTTLTAATTTTTATKNNVYNNVKESSQYSLDLINVLKRYLSKFSRLPRQSLILYATTLLLILLFLSATVLLYRISKIQNRFSFGLNDKIIINDNNNNNNNNNNHNRNDNNHNKNDDNNDNNNNNEDDDDIYNNLYQWQTHLHTKSAGAVHNFLDTNLDQIAKVRQSLEALSALLTPNRQQQQQQPQETTRESS